MSTTIDEKVVEMRFDNRDFEKNVKTSMNTLNGLKKSLDFDESTKSFSKLERASKKAKFDVLSSAVNEVKNRFSALGVIGVTALANITNSAVNAGKQIVKSLTIAPIKQGFDEYELKMGSIQTIMASTGESLETVNKYLEELNLYADKTIYSFSDMTSNIGKFTNAGVSLDMAVSAIKGVSNAAALAGANSAQASHAMYNFAQALSTGYIQLIDWKSIANASMDTLDFKNNLIETALALGTVVKKGDEYVSTTKNIRGKVSDTFTATKRFNESLSAQWMTTEVLTQTLANYSTDIRDMSVAEQKAYREKLKSVGYTEEQIEKVILLGQKATDAAQDVKTFTQLMDTLKEAVGSGWSITFEKLFGDLNEAKQLWTAVSKEIGGIIDASSDARNALISDWKKLGGREDLLKGVANVWTNIRNVVTSAKAGFRDIFPKATGESLYRITKAFRTFTENIMLNKDELDKIRRAFKGFTAILDIGKSFISAVWNEMKHLYSYVRLLGGGLLDGAANLGDFLVKVRDWVIENQIFEKGIKKVVEGVKYLAGAFDSLIQKLTGYGVIDLIKKFGENIRYFYDEMKLIIQLLFGNNTPDQLSELIKRFRELTGMNFKDSKLFNFFLTTKRIFVGFKNLISDLIHGESFSDAVKTFFGSAFGTDTGGKIFKFFNDIGETCQKAWTKVSDAFSKFKAGFEDFSGVMKTKWAEISESWEKAKISIRKSWEKIKQTISEVTGKDLDGMSKFAQVLSVLLYPIQLFFTGLGYAFKGLAIIFGDFGPTVLNFLKKFGGFIINLAKSISESFRNADFATFIDLLTSGSLALMFGKLAKSMLGLNKVKTDGVAGIFSAFSALGKDEEGNFSIIKFFTDLGKGMKKASGNIRKAVEEILMPIKDVFVAWQKDLQANVIFKIAAAIGILSASLILLSGIDEEKLMGAVGAVTALFAELIAAFRLISGSMVVKDSLGMGMIEDAKNMAASFVQFAGLLISISVAVMLLSSALKKIATLEPKQLAVGIGGITAIFAEILIFLKVISKNEKMATVGIEGLVRMSIAMYILAMSVKKLAKLDPKSMLQGIGGLGLMMAALVAFVKIVNSMPKTVWMEKGGADYYSLVNMANGFLILSVALRIMVMSVKSLGKMEAKSFEQGLLGFVSLFAMVALVSRTMSGIKGGNFAAVSASLIMFADSMILIAAAMKIMGTMDIEHIAAASVGFFGAFGLIIIALNSMKGEALTILGLAGSIFVFAEAFVVLASAMKILASIKATSMLKTLVAIGVIFGSMSMLSQFTEGKNALAASGAMLLFANALLILAPALLAIGQLDPYQMLGVIAVIGSILIMFGTTAVAFQKVILPMLAISGAIALFGVGILALGAGFVALAAGLTALGGSLPVLVEFLRILATSLLEFIPNVIIAFFKSLATSILNFGKVILVTLIETLNAILPPLVELIFNFLDKLLESLKNHLPNIVDNIIDLVLQLVDRLGRNSLKIVEKLLNFVLDLIDSLGKAFRKVSGRIIPVIAGFIKNILVGALNLVAPWLVKLLGIEVENIAEEVTDVMDILSDEEKELKKSIEDAKKAYDDMDKARQAHISETQSEWKYIKDLKDEYNGLVTEEGKIKTGFETRAETIKGLLADAMHIGVDQIETMIGANGRLGDSFDNVIKKMQAEAYLEATKSDYQEAIKSKEDDFNNYINAQKNRNDTLASIQGIEAGRRRAQEQLEYLREIEQTRMLSEDEAESAIAAQKMLDDAQTYLHNAYLKLDEFNVELSDAEKVYYGRLAIMQQWESLQAAYISGDVKAMEDAVENTINGLLVHGVATTEMLQAQADSWKEKRDAIKQLISEGYNIPQEQLDNAEAMYRKSMAELYQSKQGYEASWRQTTTDSVKSAAEGIEEGSSELTGAVDNSMDSVRVSIGTGLDQISDETLASIGMSRDEWNKLMGLAGTESGEALTDNMGNSIESGSGDVANSAKNMFSDVTDKVAGFARSSGSNAGDNYVEGAIEAIQSKNSTLDKTALDSAESVVDTYTDSWDEHSPSRRMFKMGVYFVQGLINGMRSLNESLFSTSDDLAVTTVDTISDTLMKVSDVFGSDLDVDPTIRPVIDLSNVTDGVNAINGMFGSTRTLGLTGKINRDTNMALSQKIQNGLNVNNSDVVGELGKLRGDINALNDNVGRMQVVMDTGALVGQIARPIDKTFGRQAMYKGRGI